MTTPENEQSTSDLSRLDVSAKRALSYATTSAIKDHSDIGLKHLYEAVRSEMGDFLVASDFQRKNIDPKQLGWDLAVLESFGDGNTMPPSQRNPGALSDFRAVVEYATELALSRKNPISQRINARDLLEGIAVVARKKAREI